jgi:hypothetical protein
MCNYHRRLFNYARYDSYNKTILLGTAAICVKTKIVVDAEIYPGLSLVPAITAC